MYYREYWENITSRHKKFENVIIKDGKIKYANFKGLIATGRICKQENKRSFITFVSIGTEDSKYYDLILYGFHKISEYKFLKGYGKIKKKDNCKWIEVHKFSFH